MSQAIQKRQDHLALAGSYADARAATEALREAMATMNLISPATSCGEIAEGCEVVISHVLVDLSTHQAKDKSGNPKTVYTARDVYPTDGGLLGLSRTVLNRIAASVGINWTESYRVDDGSHPYYCHWRAVGEYRSFDGQVKQVIGNKQMDLREGSPQSLKQTENQLAQQRQFIMEHAEAKAKNRAICDLGVKKGYTLEELQKPFVAARLSFTGRSADPERARMFAEKIADSFLGSRGALYSLPAPEQQRRGLPPPAIDTTADDSGEYNTETGEVSKPAATRDGDGSGAGSGSAAQPASKPAPSKPARSGIVLTLGRDKGKEIEDASTQNLEWAANYIEGKLEAEESRFPDKDRASLAAMRAELQRRGEY